MIERIRMWFEQKDPREQRVVVALFMSCLATFFWFGLYRPAEQAIDSLQSRCNKLQQDLQWLDQQALAAGRIALHTPAQSPEALVKNTLKKAGFTATVNQQDGDKLSITSSAIKIDDFVRWLTLLQQDFGLRIVALEFHASKQDSDSITLTRLIIEAKKHG